MMVSFTTLASLENFTGAYEVVGGTNCDAETVSVKWKENLQSS